MNTVPEPIELLFQTLDHFPIPCVATDAAGVVVRLNLEAAERFGWSEAVGRMPGSDGLPWPELPGKEWRRQMVWWETACVGNLYWTVPREVVMPEIPKMSKQQRATLEGLQRGMSVKEIATEHGLKESTVRTHIFRLRQMAGGSDLLSLRFTGIPAVGGIPAPGAGSDPTERRRQIC